MPKKRERKTGRPENNRFDWGYYAARAPNNAMCRLALCAQTKGCSVAQLAKRVDGCHPSNFVRSFSSKKPRQNTIDAYARALELPALARRALVDEMTERDVASVVRRVAATGTVTDDEIVKSSDGDIARAARSYVLAEYRLDREHDPLRAFLSVVDPRTAGDEKLVLHRLRRHHGRDWHELVLECVLTARRLLPFLAHLTEVELFQLCWVLDPYISRARRKTLHTAPLLELAGMKAILGRNAELRAKGEDLTKFPKAPRTGPPRRDDRR